MEQEQSTMQSATGSGAMRIGRVSDKLRTWAHKWNHSAGRCGSTLRVSFALVSREGFKPHVSMTIDGLPLVVDGKASSSRAACRIGEENSDVADVLIDQVLVAYRVKHPFK